MTDPHPGAPLRREGPGCDARTWAAVLVHGRGQDPDFMAEVARRIDLSGMHRVYPAAPGNSWYPGRFADPVEQNEPWLGRSLSAVEAALRVLADDGVPRHRTALIGFSQGACLLAEHLVRHPRRFGAVALLTGGYLGTEVHAGPGSAVLGGTPVLLSSSRVDEWVPPQRVEETAALLAAMGGRVTLRIHAAAEHGVDDAEVAAVRDLVAAAVAADR